MTTAADFERFLAEAAPDLGASVTSITPISGGYSRLTSVAGIRTADGGAQRLILRSDPPSGHGVFDSDRDDEWQLLLALWESGAIHIARPRFYDATGERLGSKTIVMDHVEGTPLQLTLTPAGDASATEFGINLGGGVLYPLAGGASIRGDFRYFKHIDNLPTLYRFTGGIAFRIGS